MHSKNPLKIWISPKWVHFHERGGGGLLLWRIVFSSSEQFGILFKIYYFPSSIHWSCSNWYNCKFISWWFGAWQELPVGELAYTISVLHLSISSVCRVQHASRTRLLIMSEALPNFMLLRRMASSWNCLWSNIFDRSTFILTPDTRVIYCTNIQYCKICSILRTGVMLWILLLC